MVLTVGRNMHAGGVEKQWTVTPVWIGVLDMITQGFDTPAKIFGVEADDGLPAAMKFTVSASVLRDMKESKVIDWEDDRRRKLRITGLGMDVLLHQHLVYTTPQQRGGKFTVHVEGDGEDGEDA